MAGNNIIVNTDDFNNAVDIINELSTTLFETKKEFESISNGLTINKQELDEKLKSLDSYLIKVAVIQKEVIGDKGLKKQSKEIVKLITDDFIKIKGQIEELQKKEVETFEKRIEKIEKLKGNNSLELQKVIDDFETKWQSKFEVMLSQKKEHEDKVDALIKTMSEKLNVNKLDNNLTTLGAIQKSLLENIKEANELQKIGLKNFLYGIGFACLIFGVGIFLNSRFHFF